MYRRRFLEASFGLAAVACSGVQVGMGRPPTGNMTPEDRERARANTQRLMAELYRPTLERTARAVAESLETTLGNGRKGPVAAASAASRITALKGRAKVVSLAGIEYSLEGGGAELAEQLRVASDANEKAQELARDRHFEVVLGIAGRRHQFGELEDVDKEQIRAELEMLREVDVVAAVALAQIAGYQAAVATHDGRLLDAVASRALKVMPRKVPPATIKDVDALMTALPESLITIRDQYIDAAHKWASPAMHPQIDRGIRAMFDPYLRIAERDKHGPDVPLDTSRSRLETPSTPPAGKRVDPEAARAYTNALLDTTSALFPAFGVVLKGIEGGSAIAKGDYKGAIDCAVRMIPAGGLAREALVAGAEIVKSKV